METLKDRLIAERKARGWSQDELASRARIRQSFIGALESINQQSSKYIPEIAEALGVRALWLKTGKGPKHYGNQLSPDEQAIIDAFRLFDDDRKDEWLYAARKKLRDEPAVKNAA